MDTVSVRPDLRRDAFPAEDLWDLPVAEESDLVEEIWEALSEQSGPSTRRSRRWLQGVILALPVLLLAGAAWAHRNVFADGYIYLHIVQNILAGNGPVFNAGQRVEAFTSPAWTFILALVGLVTPFPLDWIAVVLGILLTLGGVSMAIWSSALARPPGGAASFLLPLGAVVFLGLPPVWSLASMGLETGLSFFWLGACFALLVRWGRIAGRACPGSGSSSSVLASWSVRSSDSTAWSSSAVCSGSSGRGNRGRDAVRIIAWAAAIPVLYQVFRMGYYGVVVANTATAKEASLPRVGRGLLYFSDFVGPYWLFIPAFALICSVRTTPSPPPCVGPGARAGVSWRSSPCRWPVPSTPATSSPWEATTCTPGC